MLLRAYVRFAERDRKRHPMDYDPLARVRQLEEQKHHEMIHQALDRIYGSM